MKWFTARAALLVSLALLWLNFLTTARWANVPGALNGPKRPFVAALLVLTTIFAIRWKQPWSARQTGPNDTRWVLAAGLAMLVAGLVVWFPPWTWSSIPYLDNWATRYRATLDGLALLKGGAASGWNWFFLGGYQTSSDITQNLAAVAALPISIFGPAVGFHVLHALMFLGLPALVFADVRLEGDRSRAALAGGLTAVAVMCFSYLLLRSGDTNSLAGLSTTALALYAAHAAARGRRWGGPLLVLAMTLVAWSHVGFLIYAVVLLGLDALVQRDGRRAARAALAAAAAIVASLPLTWESWRYPAYFLPNNIIIGREAAFDFAHAARDIYYNVEMLVMPARWVNDFTGLTHACLPIIAFVAWTDRRSRAGFVALATLVVVALTRFNSAEFAYVFVRPVHLLSILTAPVLAWFLITHVPSRWLRLSFVAFVFVYLQVWWNPVPHVRAEGIEPSLVQRLRTLDGALVAVENASHRDMDLAPATTSEPTPFAVHFESWLPTLTGRRLYAGMWDGWQWSPARDQVLSGGAFRGRALADTPVGDVIAEFRKWGVAHVFVWSNASRRYFAAQSAFALQSADARWSHFALVDRDPRSVVTTAGQGELRDLTPVGAQVRLENVAADAPVVVRMNFHPSWTAVSDGKPVPIFASNGQLAFTAPRAGSYDVALVYPKRQGLLWLAMAAVIAAMAASALLQRLHGIRPDRA